MKWLLVIILAALVMAPALAGEIFVAAASSLTDVMKAIQPLYRREHTDVKLTFIYGSTGMLRTQVRQGAPCDVFIGADRASWIPVAMTSKGIVTPIEYHGSAHLNALCGADGLICIPFGVSEIVEGTTIDVRQI